MRLVTGLPALQGLLQTAVADSRERFAALPANQGEAAAAPVSVPERAAAPTGPTGTSHRLAELDPLDEEILVDRLADRLQQRLREQAIRYLGLTGGLT